MNAAVLKKNLFWILAGVGLLFTFIVFILLNVSVGKAVDAKSAEIAKELKDAAVTPKGVKAIAMMGEQDDVIADVKRKLWKQNWDKQLDLFQWPTDPDGRLAVFQKQYQKFGEPLVERSGEFNIIKRPEVYEAAYEDLAKGITPTQFAGGNWRNVLRHVADWTERRPTIVQIWLALEDLWVQTAVLEPIKAINAVATEFTATDEGQTPFKRSFRSRVWDVQLEVPQDGEFANKLVKIKLTNRTDRLQAFGRKRQLRLNVWLSEVGPPVELRVQGDFLKGNEALEVPENPVLQAIPAGTRIDKITRVELVPDTRSVPVRVIQVIELGKTDARHAAATLKPPSGGVFKELAEAAESQAAADPAEGGGPMGGMAAAMQKSMSQRGAGGAAAGSGGGTPDSVLDANLNRYVDTTEQVRRMPVGIVLVLDQMYLQDALAAYSNSALRFQVTQFHWTRYRGRLDSPSEPGDGLDGDSGPPGFGGPPGFAGGPGRGMGGLAGGRGGMSSGSGVGMMMGGMPSAPGGRAGGGGVSAPGGGYGGYPGFGGSSASLAEGQTSAGLVELSLYGIVTLYEKFEDPNASSDGPSN